MQNIRITTKALKWIAFLVVIIMFLSSIISKLFHFLHLQDVGFNMISISPISVGLGFLASVMALGLVYIERAVYKHPITHPEQLFVLVIGISGLIYNAILGILLIKNLGG